MVATRPGVEITLLLGFNDENGPKIWLRIFFPIYPLLKSPLFGVDCWSHEYLLGGDYWKPLVEFSAISNVSLLNLASLGKLLT